MGPKAKSKPKTRHVLGEGQPYQFYMGDYGGVGLIGRLPGGAATYVELEWPEEVNRAGAPKYRLVLEEVE